MIKSKKGFTLIELMIVVAIIGILAAIAIPKFADLIRKSKEGSTKGSLGAMRSALTIYYGEQEGIYPIPMDADGTTVTVVDNETAVFGDADGPFITKYLDKMPEVKLGITAIGDTSEVVYALEVTDITPADHDGQWWYRGATYGEMHVYANGQYDTKSNYITTW